MQERLTPKPHLREGVCLVEGVSRAALYDTKTGNVYSVNTQAVRVIRGEDANEVFANQLVEMDLLTATTEFASKPSIQKEKEIDPKLRFAWLEIEDRCNQRCLHCYGAFGRDPIPEKRRLTHNQWKNEIGELYSNNCLAIQFIGGEPFMYRGSGQNEDVFALAHHAQTVGIQEIEIFTNGTYLTTKIISKVKGMGLHLAVSLYSSSPKVHDAITQVPGSHRLTVAAIKRSVEAGIPVRVGFIAMRQNQETIEETIALLNDLGIENSYPDIVRPGANESEVDLAPDVSTLIKYGLKLKPDFKRVNEYTFERNQQLNTCLAEKIAITADGTVIPCIFARDIKLGNITETSLADILNSQATQKVWRTTLDNVLVCQDCEYRYACRDCRPLAVASSNDKRYNAPPARCTYDPYTGDWGKGVWNSENGELVYQRLRLAPEEVMNNGKS